MSAFAIDAAFGQDDFFDLYEAHFRSIVECGEPYFAPAGVEFANPIHSDKISTLDFSSLKIDKYYNEPTASMKPYKKSINHLFSEWDQKEYKDNQFIITNSVTTASLIVLDFLRRNKIEVIYFETPCYYATLYQCKILSIRYVLIPTYMSDEFILNTDIILNEHRPKAIWLTQPRISIGSNQDSAHLKYIRKNLRDTDFLVVDEATERALPSVVSRENSEDDRRLIRLRGIYKTLGLNGPRISAIQTSTDVRCLMLENIWQFQGGVDVFSLELMRHASSDFVTFSSFLRSADAHLMAVKRRLDAMTVGTPIRISNMVNGYTGAFICDTSRLSGVSSRARQNLILRLKEERVVPTLGASMYFAKHSGFEFIRINSFTEERILMESARRIARALE